MLSQTSTRLGAPDQREEVAVTGPGDGHHDKADQEGDEGGPDFPQRIAQRLPLGEVGHLDLQHEQGEDDGEDAVTEGQHPRRVVTPLVVLRMSPAVHRPSRAAAVPCEVHHDVLCGCAMAGIGRGRSSPLLPLVCNAPSRGLSHEQCHGRA